MSVAFVIPAGQGPTPFGAATSLRGAAGPQAAAPSAEAPRSVNLLAGASAVAAGATVASQSKRRRAPKAARKVLRSFLLGEDAKDSAAPAAKAVAPAPAASPAPAATPAKAGVITKDAEGRARFATSGAATAAPAAAPAAEKAPEPKAEKAPETKAEKAEAPKAEAGVITKDAEGRARFATSGAATAAPAAAPAAEKAPEPKAEKAPETKAEKAAAPKAEAKAKAKGKAKAKAKAVPKAAPILEPLKFSGENTSKSETWTGLTPGKEYELNLWSAQIAENTRTIRSHDWERDRFDIEFALTHGTTYNAYTVKGETATALIDSSHKKFESLFLEALESPDGGAMDLATLDYLVVSHTEPDHSGLIENILKAAAERGNDKLTVVGSKVCITFLQNLVHMDFKTKLVKDGDTIDLGGGHELEFLLTPNLHWPDTICTYDRKTQLLYTCDVFGMHYCSKEVTDVEGIQALKPHFQLYYNCLMKPNAKSATTALKKLNKLAGPVGAVCPGHGPMLLHNKDEWLDMYKTWSEDAMKKLGPAVCIFWVSRHGESERMAQALAFGLTSNDILVEMHDLNAIDSFEVVEACMRNQVIAVFAPPQSGAAQENLNTVFTSCNEKDHKFLVCESAGENEDPVDSIVSRFVQVGIPEVMPALKMQEGGPEKNLIIFEENGLLLSKNLLEKKKAAAKDKLNEKTMKALGKMGSGRYVLTASKSGVSSASVATWVMPASTEPPTVAIAVAKDANLNTMMQQGDTFVVNMLEEGNYLDTIKHFQQSFAPGADVMQGIDTIEVEGGVALKSGCSYLLCKVATRTDAADHVIITGEVTEGKMLREAPCAANYRKTAAYY